jgi:hypothetical protein
MMVYSKPFEKQNYTEVHKADPENHREGIINYLSVNDY